MSPKIQKRLDRFLRRWPQIGLPAKHPLAEFLICWRPRSRAKHLAGILVRGALPTLGYLIFVLTAAGYFSGMPARIRPIHFAVLLAIAATLVWILPRYLQSGSRSFHPNLSLLFKRMSKDAAIQLWMAPLTFRELLAIEASRAYANYRNKFRLTVEAICLLLLSLGLFIFYLCALRFDLSKIDYGVFFAGAFFLAGAFFGSSGCSSRVRPSRIALRRTWSAYASSSEDEWLLTA